MNSQNPPLSDAPAPEGFTLRRLLGDSGRVLLRHLILINPLLLFLLVLALLMPAGNPPALELRWWVLGGVLWLLYQAFVSGWLAMIRVAATAPNPPQGLLLGPLIGAFLPGVGRWFLPMTVGTLVQLLLAVLLVALPTWAVAQWVGLPSGMTSVLLSQDPQAVADWVTQLSVRGQQQLSSLILVGGGATLVYALVFIMTALWAPVLILRPRSVYPETAASPGLLSSLLLAYRASIRMFIADPWRLLSLALLDGLASYLLSAMLQSGSVWMVALWQLLALLAQTFFAIASVLYVAYRLGPVADDTPPQVDIRG